MFTPLVDPQDFPRSDIDVAGIRTARHQINCLRNDLKAVMDQMKDLLEKGLPRTSTANGTDVVIDQVEEEPVKGVGQAWAKIDAVAPNSPADSAVRALHRMSIDLTTDECAYYTLIRD